MTLLLAFILVICAIGLTAVIPENLFLHVPFQLMIIAVVLLSLHMNVRDIVILLLISSGVMWGMSRYDIIRNVNQLYLEAGILFLSGFILGIYETNYKDEKHKLNVVWNYKKKETENLKTEIQELTAENHRITESIKEFKKYFAQ
jgi:hypothetical protein